MENCYYSDACWHSSNQPGTWSQIMKKMIKLVFSDIISTHVIENTTLALLSLSWLYCPLQIFYLFFINSFLTDDDIRSFVDGVDQDQKAKNMQSDL